MMRAEGDPRVQSLGGSIHRGRETEAEAAVASIPRRRESRRHSAAFRMPAFASVTDVKCVDGPVKLRIKFGDGRDAEGGKQR
jgi:hypothetical protein